VIVLTTFLWASFREVEGTLLQAAGAGAQNAADQLATVLMQSTQQRLTELSRVAAHPTVRAYVRRPSRHRDGSGGPRPPRGGGDKPRIADHRTVEAVKTLGQFWAVLNEPPPTAKV